MIVRSVFFHSQSAFKWIILLNACWISSQNDRNYRGNYFLQHLIVLDLRSRDEVGRKKSLLMNRTSNNFMLKNPNDAFERK